MYYLFLHCQHRRQQCHSWVLQWQAVLGDFHLAEKLRRETTMGLCIESKMCFKSIHFYCQCTNFIILFFKILLSLSFPINLPFFELHLLPPGLSLNLLIFFFFGTFFNNSIQLISLVEIFMKIDLFLPLKSVSNG